jgi:hypothetical protein
LDPTGYIVDAGKFHIVHGTKLPSTLIDSLHCDLARVQQPNAMKITEYAVEKLGNKVAVIHVQYQTFDLKC